MDDGKHTQPTRQENNFTACQTVPRQSPIPGTMSSPQARVLRGPFTNHGQHNKPTIVRPKKRGARNKPKAVLQLCRARPSTAPTKTTNMIAFLTALQQYLSPRELLHAGHGGQLGRGADSGRHVFVPQRFQAVPILHGLRQRAGQLGLVQCFHTHLVVGRDTRQEKKNERRKRGCLKNTYIERATKIVLHTFQGTKGKMLSSHIFYCVLICAPSCIVSNKGYQHKTHPQRKVTTHLECQTPKIRVT